MSDDNIFKISSTPSQQLTTSNPTPAYNCNFKYNFCHACNQIINDRYLLKALDKYWHEDCLKCACCDCRLGEIGCKLYTKANLILCRKDYLK